MPYGTMKRKHEVKKMADILVLQHVDCEHLGRIAEVLDARNLTYRYVRPDKGESSGLEDALGGLTEINLPRSVPLN